MNQMTPPPKIEIIPSSAPFSDAQRSWLNGFFAGLLTDGGPTPLSSDQGASMLQGPAGDGDDGEGFLERHETDDAPTDPMPMLRDQRLRNALVTAIDALPEREQHIMGMYYEQDMNLKEIAAVLGVTEARVCQLHSQSIARLRAKMRAH